MALDLIQQSFNAGEWSPRLDGRSDLEKYYSACRMLENMIPTRFGPAERRPGFQYVAEVKDSSKKARLLSFKYSTVQAYILEAGDQYMRFYKDRGQILGGSGTEDISALDNIIAHWLLNEIEGTNVVDDDGGTHDMTASVDTSLLTQTGKVGTGCFDLDGQYDCELAHDGDFSFTTDADDTAFSLACWGYVTQQNDIQVLLSKWQNEGGTEWRLSLSNDRKLQLHLGDTSSNIASDRVAQWKLNDDAASTAVDDIVAVVPHDGVLTPSNTEDITTTGKINACFDFGGAEAVEIADHAALSFGDGAADSAFSIAAWIFVDPAANDQTIFAKYDSSVPAREYKFRLTDTEKLSLALYDESETAIIQQISDDALASGWHFVVATYDGSSTSAGITLYVDNVAIDQSANDFNVYTAMENTAIKATIGALYGAGAALTLHFKDKIDNVILFDTELTQANISTLWNEGTGTETFAGIEISAVSDDVISTGWHFFVATCSVHADRTVAADDITLYVDGVAIDSTATNDADYTAMQTSGMEIRIGGQRNSADDADEKFWGDKIDEVSVFGDVLTPAEIASLYSAIPYEIPSPYLEADLFGIQRIQSADVLYGFHSDYNPRKIKRFEHNLWELENIDFDWPPFMTENITDTTITPSGTVGTIELTATNPIFTADHVGSYWLIKHNRTDNKIEKQFTEICTLIVLGDAADSFNIAGRSDILVDVKGPYRLKTSDTWTGTVVLERSYDGILTLVLDAAPASGAWAVDDIITGATSGNTCIIVSVIDSTHYTVKQLSGSFADDEVLSNQSGNSRNTAATWPRYEGWHTLETVQSTQDQNFNIAGNEELGDAYLRTRRTVDSADNDPTITLTVERFYHYGIAKITGFTSATSVTAMTIRTLGSTNATKTWSEGAWSAQRGYPSSATFHEERLMTGGTVFEPHSIKGSKTDDWENFRTGTLDDDSIAYSLATNEVNAVRWLISKEILLMGTSGAEWKLGSFDTGEPLTPDNPTVPRVQTTYGSRDIQAIMLANVVLFVQAEGRVVRGAQYVFEKGESGGYDSLDYTILAEHITGSGIISMAYQQQPEPILWCVLDNGNLIGMTFEPGQKVWGWFRVVTDGDFEDVAVIPGVSEDEVWCIVKREINGATKRYVEYMKPRDWGDDQKDCFFVDSGLSFDGGDAVTITGITQADPAVVTMSTYPTDGDGNNIEDGDQVRIRYVGGMVEVRNKVFTVSNPNTTAKTFELRDQLDTVDIDSTAFTAFSDAISGDTTYDSLDITNVSAADIAKLSLGAPITGTGIPDDTTIAVIKDDWFTMSAKATFTGTAVTITIAGTVEQVDNSFSGLDHLEAKTVSVLGDGTVHKDVVVSSGSVTLTDYFNKVHIGLPYTSKLMPMKLEMQTRGGTGRAKIKRIDSIIFSFYKSLGCTFGTTEGTETIPFRKTIDAMGQAVPLFTGEKQQTFPGGYELNGDIFVSQEQPLPLTVRTITPSLMLYG